MNETPTANPTAAPLPRMTDAEITAAREKIAAHLQQCQTAGVSLRPITGQVIRLASRIGLDLEALGRDIDAIEDQAYFDQVILAAWLLTEDLACVVETCHDAKAADLARQEADLWALGNLDSIEREGAVLRAFVARWLEYRVEMQILKQRTDESAEA